MARRVMGISWGQGGQRGSTKHFVIFLSPRGQEPDAFLAS